MRAELNRPTTLSCHVTSSVVNGSRSKLQAVSRTISFTHASQSTNVSYMHHSARTKIHVRIITRFLQQPSIEERKRNQKMLHFKHISMWHGCKAANRAWLRHLASFRPNQELWWECQSSHLLCSFICCGGVGCRGQQHCCPNKFTTQTGASNNITGRGGGRLCKLGEESLFRKSCLSQVDSWKPSAVSAEFMDRTMIPCPTPPALITVIPDPVWMWPQNLKSVTLL